MKNPVGSKVFADRLRQLRLDKKMSRQHLADVSNIEQSTVKRIETGKSTVTLDLLISLSRALGLHVRDLVNDDAITDSDKEV